MFCLRPPLVRALWRNLISCRKESELHLSSISGRSSYSKRKNLTISTSPGKSPRSSLGKIRSTTRVNQRKNAKSASTERNTSDSSSNSGSLSSTSQNYVQNAAYGIDNPARRDPITHETVSKTSSGGSSRQLESLKEETES